MSNKNEEKYYLELFHKSYKDFPKGEIQPFESPDFLVIRKPEIIGIELTKIYQKAEKGYLPGPQYDSICNDISNKIAQKLYENNIKSYAISLTFNIQKPLYNKQRDLVSAKICSLILASLTKNKNKILLRNNYERLDIFPEEIALMQINYYPSLNAPLVNYPRAGFVKEEMDDDFYSVINKKDLKYRKFRYKCIETWLLIHTVPISNASFFKPSSSTLNNSYESFYDKIFFMDSFSNKTWSLKVNKKTT